MVWGSTVWTAGVWATTTWYGCGDVQPIFPPTYVCLQSIAAESVELALSTKRVAFSTAEGATMLISNKGLLCR